MDQHNSEAAEPANLRFLRRLVTILTTVMILGLLTIVTLIVIRMFDQGQITLPSEINLPSGVKASAVTLGKSWIAIVTEDDRILIYDALGENLLQDIAIQTD